MKLVQARNRHLLALDILSLLLAPGLALTLRLDSIDWWPRFGQTLMLYTGVALAVKLLTAYGFGLYRRYWRYASVEDLAQIGFAIALSNGMLCALALVAQPFVTSLGLMLPRSLPLLDGILSGLALSLFRLGLRALKDRDVRHACETTGQRVLVVGAGEAGIMAVREMRNAPELNMEPVAYIDDDRAKLGTIVQGLPVVGTCAQMQAVVVRRQIQKIVVAIPSAPLPRQNEIIRLCEMTDAEVHNLPGIYQLLAGHKTISRLPEVDVNRLLDRAPIESNSTEVEAILKGATVLVTGAGGSIGSELCRQIAQHGPSKMVLLGHGENSIFEIKLNLRLSFPDLETVAAIVDVRDERRVENVVSGHQPDIIFHAAAHKHVPLMEESVREALHNNVLGTLNVLRAAQRNNVPRFILISTDKAVNPSSVMGASKRLAELLTGALARRTGKAYAAVRFGNVLGSRGSVIPIFQRQIAAGGPVTVTHPDMRRFFMTIPEAVHLVLGAASMAAGGEVFVLDMGSQVRILDLAKNMVKLSGLKPGRDIEIVYSGVRPGEKLAEELFVEHEATQRTQCERILVATDDRVFKLESLQQLVHDLVEMSHGSLDREANERMRDLLLAVCHQPENYVPALETKGKAAQPGMKQHALPQPVLVPAAIA